MLGIDLNDNFDHIVQSHLVVEGGKTIPLIVGDMRISGPSPNIQVVFEPLEVTGMLAEVIIDFPEGVRRSHVFDPLVEINEWRIKVLINTSDRFVVLDNIDDEGIEGSGEQSEWVKGCLREWERRKQFKYLVNPDSGQIVLTRGFESLVAPKLFLDILFDHTGMTEGMTLAVPTYAWEELKEMINQFKETTSE